MELIKQTSSFHVAIEQQDSLPIYIRIGDGTMHPWYCVYLKEEDFYCLTCRLDEFEKNLQKITELCSVYYCKKTNESEKVAAKAQLLEFHRMVVNFGTIYCVTFEFYPSGGEITFCRINDRGNRVFDFSLKYEDFKEFRQVLNQLVFRLCKEKLEGTISDYEKRVNH